MNQQKTGNRQIKILERSSWVLIIIGVLMMTIFWMVPLKVPSSNSLGNMADWGSWFGGVGAPFFNLAGFIMIYIAFLQQSKNDADAQVESNIQRFEHTLIQLLQLHYQQNRDLQLSFGKMQQGTGEIDFFETSRNNINRAIRSAKNEVEIQNAYIEYYKGLNKSYQFFTEHFFRNLFLLLEYIYREKSLGENTKAIQSHWMGIVQAQLSIDELYLIYYHRHQVSSHKYQEVIKWLIEEQFFSPIEPGINP